MQKQLTNAQVKQIKQAFATFAKLNTQLDALTQMQFADGECVYDITHWDLDMERVMEELMECGRWDDEQWKRYNFFNT
tara:strand:+ start:382 stop:615 length:234 start_codon:yes stop_codon:yes gene_type:complete